MKRTHRGYTMVVVLLLATLFFLFLAAAMELQSALHRHNLAAKTKLQAKARQLAVRVIANR